MKKYLIIGLFASLLFSNNYNDSCIISKDNREIYRNDFTHPETIQSDNFAIHFTTADVDSQFVNGQWFNLQCNEGYAESILNHLEAALSIYLEDGWENVPSDCDESITDLTSPHHCINFGGNALYDIYLSNDGVGMVVPETPYSVEPYTGGYTSYMKISTLLNQHETIPPWSFHVIAHELHHSIQLRYGSLTSGSPGNYMHNLWLFEQTATYMENVIYPESIHLSTMLGNCNVVTPLTYPHYNIDYPAEIYPYRSALWQKFLVESIGDSSIVRDIWERYGSEYSTGNVVSLFPIYDQAIEQATNNNSSLSESYSDYAEWRYFTGSRSIPNTYFNQASAYCEATIISDLDNIFILSSNKGASKFINLPSDNISISILTDFFDDINFSHLKIGPGSQVQIVDLSYQNNSFNFNISNDDENILIVNSNYNDENSFDMNFSISINELNIPGDINIDNEINVLDVVLLVSFILGEGSNEYNYFIADINQDNSLDVLDVVQLVSIILN